MLQLNVTSLILKGKPHNYFIKMIILLPLLFNILNIIERLRELSATPWQRDPARTFSVTWQCYDHSSNESQMDRGTLRDSRQLKSTRIDYIMRYGTCRRLYSFCMFMLTFVNPNCQGDLWKNPAWFTLVWQLGASPYPVMFILLSLEEILDPILKSKGRRF